jgi:hypothetical protein
MEGAAPFNNLGRVGAPLLFINGLVALCLNVAGVFLIDSVGSLVLTLAGVGKVSRTPAKSPALTFQDVLLICLAWVMGSYISLTQTVGEFRLMSPLQHLLS